MEAEFINWLRSQVPSHPHVALGIGDDAALLARVDAELVVTSDMLMDGVHFRLDECGAFAAGRKAIAVNLSDLAAMAARPLAVCVSVAVPRNGGLELAKDLYGGMLEIAERYASPICGGDTNAWDGPCVVNVAAFGAVDQSRAWRRSNARPGDLLVVTGSFGGSLLGRHLSFSPRVTEALSIAEHYQVHAATDISDGLSLDAAHLAEQSGCGLELEMEKIPIAEAAHRRAQRTGHPPLFHALQDGEDFELAMAIPEEDVERLLKDESIAVSRTVIGRFIEEPGLWIRKLEGGSREPCRPQGYQHGSSYNQTEN